MQKKDKSPNKVEKTKQKSFEAKNEFKAFNIYLKKKKKNQHTHRFLFFFEILKNKGILPSFFKISSGLDDVLCWLKSSANNNGKIFFFRSFAFLMPVNPLQINESKSYVTHMFVLIFPPYCCVKITVKLFTKKILNKNYITRKD